MNSWEVASASLGGGSLQVQSPRTEVTLLLSKPWSLARGLLGISLDGDRMLRGHRLLYQHGVWGFLDGHSPRSFINIIKFRTYLVLIQSLQRD